jgi:hypothetical protein
MNDVKAELKQLMGESEVIFNQMAEACAYGRKVSFRSGPLFLNCTNKGYGEPDGDLPFRYCRVDRCPLLQ